MKIRFPFTLGLVVVAVVALTASAVASGHDALKLPGVPEWGTTTPPDYITIDEGDITVEGVTVEIVQAIFVSQGRFKRMFVGIPPSPSGGLVHAFNGSNDTGDAARWLIWPGDGWLEFEYRWPVVAAAREGLPFIAIDTPQFGLFEYTATAAQQIITDDIYGAKVGLDILQRRGIEFCGPMFAGGLSWGATRAMEFAAAVPNVSHMYAAGGQLQTSWSNGYLPFDPPEWEGVWDYTDLLKALDGQVRLAYGDPNMGEYMWRENSQALLDDLASEPNITVHQFAGPHRIDPDDLQAFIGSYATQVGC